MFIRFFGYSTKIAAIGGTIAVVLSVSQNLKELAYLEDSELSQGKIIELRDRVPYGDEPNSLGLDFPVIEYVDEHGVVRTMQLGKGAFGSYFSIGQTITLAKTRGGYKVADRWFIWQDSLAYLASATLATVIAIVYHLLLLSPMPGKVNKRRSNKSVQTRPTSRPV